MFNFKLLILSSLVGVYVRIKKRRHHFGDKATSSRFAGLIFAKAGGKDIVDCI